MWTILRFRPNYCITMKTVNWCLMTPMKRVNIKFLILVPSWGIWSDQGILSHVPRAVAPHDTQLSTKTLRKIHEFPGVSRSLTPAFHKIIFHPLTLFKDLFTPAILSANTTHASGPFRPKRNNLFTDVIVGDIFHKRIPLISSPLIWPTKNKFRSAACDQF